MPLLSTSPNNDKNERKKKIYNNIKVIGLENTLYPGTTS